MSLTNLEFVDEPPKKGPPRGSFGAHLTEKGNGWKYVVRGVPRGPYKKKKKTIPMKISEAYKAKLNDEIPVEIAQLLSVSPRMSWAELIALQTLKKAVGVLDKDSDISFTAITELRESTEGKTPERVAIGGGNAELDALAKAIAAGPAPTATDEPISEEQ